MLMKNWLFSLAFAIIFVTQLVVEWNGLTDVNYITKPLITISLMIFYVTQTQLKGKFAKKIFFGLVFGLAGDCFLMLLNKNASFFIFGLLSFLIGHLFYVSAFYQDFKSNPVIQKAASRIALVVFGIFCTSFLSCWS